MQVLQRCRNTIALELTNPAAFHSTTSIFQKWKTNFNSDDDAKVEKLQQPSKDYIRYVVREKRASSKKAINDLLFNLGCSRPKFEESFSKIEADDADRSNKKSRMKPSRHAKRAYRKKIKSSGKHRQEKSFDNYDEHERIFQEKFGEHCYTWSFKNEETEFDWRETSGHGYFRNKKYQHKNQVKFDDESFTIGTVADRRILGLPLAGPLNVENVKAAFRLSALKWHPDKNQDSSRAGAEEKFKHCVNAYKSLCSALSVP